ncbi:MAG TPA: phage tail tape measure C-terminal domain-containing protein [Rhizomicrobium sp.]|nr:phage tail tape measure C-terminal domain-containing protein [Rhizomicrobium sp.]
MSESENALGAAAEALSNFVAGPVASATGAIDAAVTRSFNSVAKTISGAALSGKLSMDGLVSAILSDFDRIATSQFITKPIEGALGQIASSLMSSIMPVGGARAAGGPVDAGVPYLVGEQGPELFTPQQSGAITPNGAASPINVHITTPDAQSFLKSESQVAALLSRVLAKGQRNL